ncbi:MAG: hypothetical protein A2Z83_04485 [Omnitrophica bacterium GWA2_52_8]|nr:MAG: hypothetical protein A2Z83_04485 [Omnitrophica bacterium GWA2_52_8]
MIKYILPKNWIIYNLTVVTSALAEAKAAVLSLQTIPYQKSWVESLQRMELKREVAGTSRIEGADFTDRELDAAMKETPDQLLTRSQKQAYGATQTYRWITKIPDDCPADQKLVCEIHARIVKDCDEDHCVPGKIREIGQNVLFGQPRHRGAEGGEECKEAFEQFTMGLKSEYFKHDRLIQALAAHYHLAAMHPFLDGNGRTARALEALLLQRAGLRDTCFIAMSNYYYDEKIKYLETLAQVRAANHDLTEFLLFGLRGIASQSNRLLQEIKRQVAKALFRNLMYDLFNRLKSPRTRALTDRQLEILKCLLDADRLELTEVRKKTENTYQSLKSPQKAFIRDLNNLIGLHAVRFEKLDKGGYDLWLNLNWPAEITETEFFEQVKKFPKAKTHPFLS